MNYLENKLYLLTEPAIQTADAFRALGLLGLAAVVGPLFIGGLFFGLTKTRKERKK